MKAIEKRCRVIPFYSLRYPDDRASALLCEKYAMTAFATFNAAPPYIDGLVKSPFSPLFVIPAEAGIHLFKHVRDSRLRGNDRLGDFLQVR